MWVESPKGKIKEEGRLCGDKILVLENVTHLDPAVVDPKDTVMAQGEELKATCNALSTLRHTQPGLRSHTYIHTV
ncbi:hypothetical protein INR49_018269 [Caranx melampygus]|nr:hypothetical protein INR49_018269 [Caranx melampygus]